MSVCSDMCQPARLRRSRHAVLCLQERFAANMPRARGFMLRSNPNYPHLSAWFDAMDARPAYQQVREWQAGSSAVTPSTQKPAYFSTTLQLLT